MSKIIFRSDPDINIIEWDEFRKLNLKRIRDLLNQPVIVDGRNMFEPDDMKKLGFRYICMGRK